MRLHSVVRFDSEGACFALPVFSGDGRKFYIQDVFEYGNKIRAFREFVFDNDEFIEIESEIELALSDEQILSFVDDVEKVHVGTVSALEQVLREFLQRRPDEIAVCLQIAELIGSAEEREIARSKMQELVLDLCGSTASRDAFAVSGQYVRLWSDLINSAKDAQEAECIISNRAKYIVTLQNASSGFRPKEGAASDGNDESVALRTLVLAANHDPEALEAEIRTHLAACRAERGSNSDLERLLAERSLALYAPLAWQIGMYETQAELEDIAFRCVYRDKCSNVASFIEAMMIKNENLLSELEYPLRESLVRGGIVFELEVRIKSIREIVKEMVVESRSIWELTDIISAKILVSEIPECYAALGVVHKRWRVIPSRFNDYISMPFPNGYRSLHTTIDGPSQFRVQVVIRTKMLDHFLAQSGKMMLGDHAPDENIPEYSSRFDDVVSAVSSAYKAKTDVNSSIARGGHKKVCFSPKGKALTLPVDASVLDFAYAIHTDIGDTCVSCRINGIIRSVDDKIESGDVVEIIRSAVVRAPVNGIASTRKARKCIRRNQRREYIIEGISILRNRFIYGGFKESIKNINAALPEIQRKANLKIRNMDELHWALGSGNLDVDIVYYTIFGNRRRLAPWPGAKNRSSAEPHFFLTNSDGRRFAVRGLLSQLLATCPVSNESFTVIFSPAGGVPGEECFATFNSDSKAFTVFPRRETAERRHGSDAELVYAVEWVSARWSSCRFPARIRFAPLMHKEGVVYMCEIVGDLDAQVVSINAEYPCVVAQILCFNIWNLRSIMSRLSNNPFITDVERLHI